MRLLVVWDRKWAFVAVFRPDHRGETQQQQSMLAHFLRGDGFRSRFLRFRLVPAVPWPMACGGRWPMVAPGGGVGRYAPL
eukprot:1237455-Prymnesium_polylepis.1